MRMVSQGMMIKFTDIVAKRTPMTNIRNMLPKIPAKSKRSYPHRWSLLLTTKIKMEHIFKMGMRTLWARKCPPNLIGRS
jgi:ribosomal protein S30